MDSVILLDACCLINFAAGGVLDDMVLSSSVATLGAAKYVLQYEVLNVLEPVPGSMDLEKRRLDISHLIGSGKLLSCELDNEAEADSALRLIHGGFDQGEAVTCAIAISRMFGVATDEKKVRSYLRERGVAVHGTVDMVKEYVERAGLGPSEIRGIIARIRDRGRFTAAKHDKLFGWWNAHLDQRS